MKTIIFTDGSSRGNPGPGGWGAILIQGKNVKEMGGSELLTTNNRMELGACINSLNSLEKGEEATLYSDSEYVIKGITLWVHDWKKRNWKNSQKKPVLNRDLWERLLEATLDKKIDWKYVKGHSENVGNDRCDQIATTLADGKDPYLYEGSLEKYPFTNILKSFLA